MRYAKKTRKAGDSVAQTNEDKLTAPFGLLGRTLGHSWSPQIHERLGSVPYALIELEPNELEPFVCSSESSWQGLNVTIPYKRDAARLADEVSDNVKRLGVANTLIRRSDGTIFADNTDLAGFAWMLERFCAQKLGATATAVLGGQEVLVLGSGGASQAVRAALIDVGATPVIVSRKGPETYEGLTARHPHAALVVNATPVGMYPNCPATPLSQEDLANLRELKGVVDVVYNPLRTGLCLAAEQLGLPYESGLGMLVAQARASSELFQGRPLADDLVATIRDDLVRSMANVILIGMPGAGKTSCGKRLAKLIGRSFVDMDHVIEADCGRSPADIISEDGEAAFRSIETRVTAAYASRSGLVIACGGGVVTRPENYAILHQNGTIVLIDRPLDQLRTEGRPISQKHGVEALAAQRMGLYRSWADLILPCTGSADGDALAVRDKLGLTS